MKVALPFVEAGTGSEIYSRSLFRVLTCLGVDAELIPVPRRYEFGIIKSYKLAKKLRSFDVVHANADYGIMFYLPDVPLVLTAHHNVDTDLYNQAKSRSLYFYHKTWLTALQAQGLKKASYIIFPSIHSQKSFLKKFPKEITDFEVVYNGVAGVAKPSCSSTRVKGQVLVVGGASVRKGADLWPEIMKSLPEYTLMCAGAVGEDIDNIRYLGRVSDEYLQELYFSSEVLLSTSRVEGFGYSAVEALYRGCPVVCLKDSPMSELFYEGREGKYVEACDSKLFSSAIDEVASSNRTSLCSQAMKLAQNLDERVWAEKIADIYLRVCEKGI